MDLSGLSLANIRAMIRGEHDPVQLRRWSSALRADRRGGAASLLATCERRLREEAAERNRLHALFEFRRQLRAEGALRVAGVDEVGVGPLAGPVVAAAVILSDEVELPGLNDSKKLTPAARERLDGQIRAQALACSIGSVDPSEIDRLNIFRASLEAMRRAVVGLPLQPDHVLVDARSIPRIAVPQTAIIGGDALDGSIAAASIVAKVYRDRIMVGLDGQHPGYGFAQHKGYGTPAHLVALRSLGALPIHLRSFAPVAEVLGAR